MKKTKTKHKALNKITTITTTTKKPIWRFKY